ncbi:hypothetical protein B0H11DRAFT_1929849 [Mycena galericulata]|nr:hypothetical protein B0H11DRAFT_1929849 [Mycena galericulata]
MSDTKRFEVLHSGQYWQDLRRRSKIAKAEAAARAETFAPILSHGSTVVTFTPGRADPIISYQQPNGRLIRVLGSPPRPARPTTKRQHIPRPPRALKTNSILACRARDDEILLARLKASRQKREREEELLAAGPQLKKQKKIFTMVRDLNALTSDAWTSTEAVKMMRDTNVRSVGRVPRR